MRRSIPMLAAAVALGAASTAVGIPAFGTADRSKPPTNTQARLVSTAIGRNAGFDRVVFRFANPAPGYTVRYVARAIHDPSGRTVPLLGGAVLQVVLQGVIGRIGPDRTPRFPAIRQMKSTGNFEAVVSFGLGVTAKHGFRVFTLHNPERLVVDVRH